MRPQIGMLRSRSLRLTGVLLVAMLLLSWSLAHAQNTLAPIYRAGVSDAPVTESPSAAPLVTRQHLYVVAGDVRAPGVFYSDRDSVSVEELLVRAGGASSLYEPMVHRVSGVRVVETLQLSDASDWRMADGELLRVVGPRGVHDARVEPLTTTAGSHVVCLGLSSHPALIALPEGRTTLNDLLDITGQSRDLAGVMLILPVRVYPREAPAGLESGTLVIFPSEKVILSAIPAGIIAPPAPLEPEPAPSTNEQVQVPDVSGVGNSVPALLPSRTTRSESATSTLFVPGTSIEPATSSANDHSQFVREASITRHTSSSQSQDVTLSHSVVPADVTPTSSSSATTMVPATRPRTSVDGPRQSSATSRLAVYTAGLAVIVLALSGIWTYWDRMRSIAMSKSFSEQSLFDTETRSAKTARQVTQVQALIDNKVPIIEETVEAPRARQFFGEAWGQRRLRLDAAQPLAGPHAAFRPQPSATRESLSTSVSAASQEPAESQSRQLQRMMAVLSAEQSRSLRRRSMANEAENEATDSAQAAKTERVTRESSLERALRQVMRKNRS